MLSLRATLLASHQGHAAHTSLQTPCPYGAADERASPLRALPSRIRDVCHHDVRRRVQSIASAVSMELKKVPAAKSVNGDWDMRLNERMSAFDV